MKHTINIFFCLIVALALTVNPPARAQQRPDAGTLLQEQRQLSPTLPDRLPAEREREMEAPAMTDTGIRVKVKAFRFTGIAGIATEAELEEFVRSSIGKELGFADLKRIASDITNYLREKKGYLLARAYLPRQDITEGIITIAIISGRTEGRMKINVKEPKRIRPSVLEGISDNAVPPGTPARIKQIERAVLLMNDLPGISAQASLEPGDKPETTRIVINATEGPLLEGTLSGDNYGDRYTGMYRGTGKISVSDLSGYGDQLGLSLTGAANQYLWRGAYTLPLSSNGLTWNASYTGLTYELGKELTSLRSKGWADTIGTGISYPVTRSRNNSITTGLGAEYAMLTDEANGAKTRDRKITTGNASLSGSFFDTLYGGGLTNFSLILTGGNVDLSGCSANQDNDNATARTYGTFARATYFLARLQRITKDASFFSSARGQFTSNNLDSSQKFILGGPTGIRAYPVGEAPADEGHAITLEMRYDVPSMPSWATTQIAGIFDSGWVKIHKTPWPNSITSASGENEYILSGAGIGINVGKAGLYSIRALYARKIGPNEGRSAAGTDADGLSDDGRFWFQLTIWI